MDVNDLISRREAIDAAIEAADDWDGGCSKERERFIREALEELPSAQPEEAIPVSWIEAKIERFMMAGDAFSGLTASIIRTMLNEWKKEQEGGTK